jgi:phosphoglycolate phosphatase
MRRLVPEAEPRQHLALADAYRRAFWRHRAAGAHAEELFAGALDLLVTLHARQGTLLGIATGKSRRGVAHLIARHGFEGWFATVQTSDDHPSKPDPAMLRAALAETGIAAGDAVMVGDTSFDMEMARAAGLKALGVAWGHHEAGVLESAGAQNIAGNFNELQQQLDSLWQE